MQLGAGSGFAVGDEVYALTFGQASNGSYAEYLSLPSQFVAKKPRNLSFEEAACIPLATITAYRSMVASRALESKGPIFIAGAAGGVGFMAVQLARHLQSGPIFTVAGSEESSRCMTETLKIEKKNILPYKGLSTDQLRDQLIALNRGSLFAATFDFVGKEMKDLCLALATYEGQMVTTVPEAPTYNTPVWTRGVSPCFAKNLNVHFIFIGAEKSFSGKPDSWVFTKSISQKSPSF